jgi:hypothetical protein
MQDLISYGAYAARLFSRYFLALIIFLNICGLLYLVNNELFFILESFCFAYNKYVKAKIILFLIKGHKTRIIKNVIKNMNGSMFNFILHDVAMVDNFHRGIVLENRLARAKM